MTTTNSNEAVIKVTSFGETRFMKATLIHDGSTLYIPGFAAKLGNGAKVHCVGITIPVSRISEDGSYNVDLHASAPYILGRHGVLIGFWKEENDANASAHIHSSGGHVNNVADPAIAEAAALEAAAITEAAPVADPAPATPASRVVIRKTGSGFTVKLNGGLIATCTDRAYAEFVKTTAEKYFNLDVVGVVIFSQPAPEEVREINSQALENFYAAPAAAKFQPGDKAGYGLGIEKGEVTIISVAVNAEGSARYVVEGFCGMLTGVRDYDLSELSPDPAPTPEADLVSAPVAEDDVIGKLFEFKHSGFTGGETLTVKPFDTFSDYNGKGALFMIGDRKVWGYMSELKEIGSYPAPAAPEELPCTCEYICQLCAHVWKAPLDADDADVPSCPACRSDMAICTTIKSDPRPACDQPEQSLPDMIRAAVEEYGFGRFFDEARQYAHAHCFPIEYVNFNAPAVGMGRDKAQAILDFASGKITEAELNAAGIGIGADPAPQKGTCR